MANSLFDVRGCCEHNSRFTFLLKSWSALLWQNKVPQIPYSTSKFPPLFFWTLSTGRNHVIGPDPYPHTAVVLWVSVVCHVNFSTPKPTKEIDALKQFHPVFQVTALFPIRNYVRSTVLACSWRHALEMSQSVNESLPHGFKLPGTRALQMCVCSRGVEKQVTLYPGKTCAAFVTPVNNGERCPQ